MGKHMVKCPICDQIFDASVESYVLVSNGRRYAHKVCYEVLKAREDKIKRDKNILESYIKAIFNYEIIPDRVNRQIKQYIKEKNYSYSGIYKTLKYWFEIKGNSIEKANGGIGM